VTLKLEVGERDETVAAEITARLAAFNHAAAPDCDSTPFQVTLRDDAGKLVGAVIAAIRFDVLRIDDVFVDDSVRGQDWGTKLMDACEGEGVARGARLATVMTYSWQARPFYEKRGYTLFAELPYNQGEHHIYWLKKTLCE
jgi:GNAT superfamily N-acetyltransferase